MQDNGEKMSKSAGNALSPQAISSTLGTDILRLWVTSIDYHADMALSQDILKQVSESYRKIRNTFRFIHGNITDFNYETDAVALEDMSLLNRYVLNEVIKVNATSLEAYKAFEYKDVTTAVLTSLTNMMSSYYLDYTKDILYIEKADDSKRREIQTVLYHALVIYSRLMAPIIPHTMEELNRIFEPEMESIHLSEFSPLVDSVITEEEAAQIDTLFTLREAVFKALEVSREEKVIGKSLEAHVSLNLDEQQEELVKSVLGEHSAQWFIVSKLSLTDEEQAVHFDVQVGVEAVSGETCPRCWNIVDSVDENGLCPRCHKVMDSL